ncbi:hypothetical protein IPJ91_02995 [bacterium]|nr:MAG: hypothetical protein IPJ91_02995 [bacterium]
MKKFFEKSFLTYIRIIAKLQLKKYKLLSKNLKIIGISGSAGKTSTMDALYAVLKTNFKVKYSYKANSETGIPLDILGIQPPEEYSIFEWFKIAALVIFKLITNWQKYDIYIVEMGVDAIEEPKNMKYLLRIVVPDIAIYLNINAVHSSNYETQIERFNESDESYKNKVEDAIAKDKSLLISSISETGVVILNMSDQRVANSKKLAKCKVIEVSQDNQIHFIKLGDQIYPKHYDITFKIAHEVGKLFNLTDLEIENNLITNFHLEPGRCSIFDGFKNSTLIDSSYNSSKEPCMDLLELLKYCHVENSYKIGVLGDMRELGSSSKLEHTSLAEFAFSNQVADEYYLVGPEMKNYFSTKLIDLGFEKAKIHTFEKASELANSLIDYLQHRVVLKDKKLVILVKGSQNTIFTEIVVEQLLANPEDKAKLCRRGKFWDERRKNY